MQLTLKFSMWCRREVYELKKFKEKGLGDWCEQFGTAEMLAVE